MSFSWDPCSCKYVQHQVLPPSITNVCVFCLNLCDRSFSLPACTHLGIFEDICHKLKTQDVGICLLCHRMLVKCNLFKKQVEESVQRLNNQTAKVSTSRNFCNLHQSIPTIIEIKQNFTSNNILTIIPLNLQPTPQVKTELLDEIDVKSESSDSESSNNKLTEHVTPNSIKPSNLYSSSINKLIDHVEHTIDNINNTYKIIAKPSKIKYVKQTTKSSHENTTKNIEHNISDVSKKSDNINGEDEEYPYFDSCESSEEEEISKKREDEQPKVYTCKYCGETFQSYNKCRYHIACKHRNSECLECGKVLSNPDGLRIHMQRVHTVANESFICDTCGKSYKSRRDIQHHIKLVHDYDRSASAYCAPCHAFFKSKSNYNIHLKKHSAHVKDSDKKFECAECNSRFLSKCLLKLHIEFDHLKMAKFNCTKCDKGFKKKNCLKKHIDNVHEKIPKTKDKICDVCGKAFSAKILLTVHMRVHTGERPLKCDLCDWTFAHPAALYTHRRLKHKVLPMKAQTLETSKVPIKMVPKKKPIKCLMKAKTQDTK